jgi:hypothetical protein
MIDNITSFLSVHSAFAALIYSWGSFEIGRMYYGMKRRAGMILWCTLGIAAAVIYAIAGCFLGQWISAILLFVTIVFQIKFLKRWVNTLPQSPHDSP